MIPYLNKKHAGFALPTILIASVVMIIVMLAAIQSVVSIRVALDNQYYEKLGQEAAESGAIMAQACLKLTGGVPSTGWNTTTNTLRPDTDCSGNTDTSKSPYVFTSKNIRTSFSVPRPTLDANGQANTLAISGKVELLRTSNGLPWQSSSSELATNLVVPYVDDSLPVGASLSGYWSAAPAGYLLEDGSAVSRTTYAALFAVITTSFGAGDGSTTFNLPDSRGRVGVNKSTDAEFDTLGEKYGEKAHTLTIAEMPYHNHEQYVCANNGSPGVRRDYRADVAAAGAYPQGISTEPTGGGGAHNEIQPSIVKMSAIKFSPPSSSASTVPAGTSISGYWASAPAGYLVEDGSARTRATDTALFSAIGTQYGSSSSTTFNLPDSRGRVAVNKSTDVEFDTLGEKYGTKTVTLDWTQMPVHSHNQRVTANSGGPAVRNDYYNDGGCTAYPQGVSTSAVGGQGPHNNIQPSIVKLNVIKQTAAVTNENVIKPGSSVSGYWSTAPAGYLLEDGSAVSRATYAALFAAIGTAYGAGDGSTTFNLPDSRGRVAVNKSTDAEFDTLGEKYGTKTHTVQISEMPSHSHEQYITYYPTTGGVARNDYGADASGSIYPQGLTTGPNGGGAAHNNIQPSIVVLTAIKT